MAPLALLSLALFALRSCAQSAGKWTELPGKTCYEDEIALTVPNMKLADCFTKAHSEGYQVFTFDGSNAYFRTRSAQDCQDHVRNTAPKKLLFVQQGVPPPPDQDWVDPAWMKLEHKDCDIKAAISVEDAEIHQCFRTAASKGYEVFSIENGVASFGTRKSEDCQGNLIDAPTKTLYVFNVSTTTPAPTAASSTTSTSPMPPTTPVVEVTLAATTSSSPVTPVTLAATISATPVTPVATTSAPSLPTTLAPQPVVEDATSSAEPTSWIDVMNKATDSSGRGAEGITAVQAALTDAAKANTVQAEYDATSANKWHSPLAPSLPVLTAALTLFALGAWAWRSVRGRPRVDTLEQDSERAGLE